MVMGSKSSRDRSGRVLLGCALAWLLLTPRLRAQEGGDLQAQILYAYQTEDLARLRALRANLLTGLRGEHPTAAARYHLAHADYRIASLARGQHAMSAEALQECAEQLSRLSDADPAPVEVLALQSICWLELSRERKLQAVFLRARAADALERASRADPRNPRVKLAQALQKLKAGLPTGPVPAELGQAVELFDHSSATSEETPGWGHAEAYLLMGHELRVRGDVLGARNWIEKALITAPDYKAAQAELAQLNR
jgi:tetratricopeptide (TPR) repeat protein